MSLSSAFLMHEGLARQAALEDAWGHLAPKRNAIYRGHFVFAVGCCGSDDINPTLLDVVLVSRKCGELDSSPWFYDAITDLMSEWASDGRYGSPKQLPSDWPSVEAGGVYRWEGYFKNYKFVGSLRRLQLS